MKRSLLLVLSFTSSVSFAMANVETGHIYIKQPRSSAFCDSQVRPEVTINDERKLTLAIGARIGFIWENSSARTDEGGCVVNSSQQIEEHGQSSTLVAQVEAECKGSAGDSQRETLTLNGKIIEYKAEPLIKKGKEWIVDSAKPSYFCIWKAR